jgi:hypothetical protein
VTAWTFSGPAITYLIDRMASAGKCGAKPISPIGERCCCDCRLTRWRWPGLLPAAMSAFEDELRA